MLKIGYTYGDPGGIGPEIFKKFYQNSATKFPCEVQLLDDETHLDSASSKIPLGQPSAYAGEHVYKTLEKAIKLLKNKELDFLVTGPVSKESLSLAGLEYGGQTELLANLVGLTKDQVEMFFLLGEFKFVLATRHIALKQVPIEFSKRLAGVLENSNQALKKIFNIKKPNIAIAGLNPHAGENGLFGDEEEKVIKPIVQNFLAKHPNEINIEGPFAADYLFANFAKQYLKKEKPNYDLYVSAYHDQALPLIKGLGGYGAINLTAGLPFLRLSVDHGTAFDIAGRNLASYEGLEACTECCLKIHNLSFG